MYLGRVNSDNVLRKSHTWQCTWDESFMRMYSRGVIRDNTLGKSHTCGCAREESCVTMFSGRVIHGDLSFPQNPEAMAKGNQITLYISNKRYILLRVICGVQKPFSLLPVTWHKISIVPVSPTWIGKKLSVNSFNV